MKKMSNGEPEHVVILIEIAQLSQPIEAEVLPTVIIQKLIDKLVIDCQLPRQKYELIRKDNLARLDSQRTIGHEDIQTNTCLILQPYQPIIECKPITSHKRVPFATGDSRASLQFFGRQDTIPLNWHPAILGRYDDDPQKNVLLALDVSRIFPSDLSVSRHHAYISYRAGEYYLCHLSEKGRTYLNDELVKKNRAYRLRGGDNIRLSKSILLIFLLW